jgi:hypothetical protein
MIKLFKTVLKRIFCRLNVSETLYKHRINQYLGLNQQLFDLGLNVSQLYHAKDVAVRNCFVISQLFFRFHTPKYF